MRLEWQAADSAMLCGSYSQGFKSGIFLSGQRSPVLEPENVDAWELGIKSMFLDRRLQLNSAAFYYDYTDLQQGRSVPAGTSGFTLVYENAVSAEIKGLEAEWSWSLGATLDFMLTNEGWSGSATVNAAYRDKVYFSQFNHDALSQDSVTILNANVLFTAPGGQWTINAWAKNLTDETAYMGTFILNSSRTNAGFLAPPRTWGVTVGYSFWKPSRLSRTCNGDSQLNNVFCCDLRAFCGLTRVVGAVRDPRLRRV